SHRPATGIYRMMMAAASLRVHFLSLVAYPLLSMSKEEDGKDPHGRTVRLPGADHEDYDVATHEPAGSRLHTGQGGVEGFASQRSGHAKVHHSGTTGFDAHRGGHHQGAGLASPCGQEESGRMRRTPPRR